MRRSALAAAAILILHGGAAGAQPAAKRQLEIEYEAAQGHYVDCYGGRREDACRALVEAYTRAMNATDATAAARHVILGQWLHAMNVYGNVVEQHRGAAPALEIYLPAFQEVIRDYDGGSHYHALIDNLLLQKSLVLALTSVGRAKAADAGLATARMQADAAYSARDNARGPDDVEIVHNAMTGSEELETAVGDYFRDRSKSGDETARTADRERAIEAYRRAGEWLVRSSKAGVKGAMVERGEIRHAELNLQLGRVLMDAGRREEAEQAFANASIACVVADSAEVSRLGVVPPNALERERLESQCVRATLGVGLPSGQAAGLIRRRTDAMIADQMQVMARKP